MITRTISTSDVTWEQLRDNPDTLKRGDRISVELKNNDKIEVDVAHDEAGKVFFVFRDCYGKHCMNTKWSNYGGWEESDMRKYANEDIFKLLPDELQAVIVPTKIVQVLDGKRHETKDKLFCLSSTQVFGKYARRNKQNPNDSRLDIFKKKKARLKYFNGEPQAWWLRSTSNAFCFCCINANACCETYGYAPTDSGVVLAFCIGG